MKHNTKLHFNYRLINEGNLMDEFAIVFKKDLPDTGEDDVSQIEQDNEEDERDDLDSENLSDKGQNTDNLKRVNVKETSSVQEPIDKEAAAAPVRAKQSLKETINNSLGEGWVDVFVYRGDLYDVKGICAEANDAWKAFEKILKESKSAPQASRYAKLEEKIGPLGILGSVWQVARNKTHIIFESKSEAECSKICAFLNRIYKGNI